MTDIKIHKVACGAHSFPLPRVRLLESPFKSAMDRSRTYLLTLDADRLLHMFRVTAGLAAPGAAYGGWERPDCEVRGHSLGHYLSGCALMHAATAEEALKERVDMLVVELAKCQEAMPGQGFNAGYLCAFPESFFDRVDACKPVWVPWYTCHKIMQGLLDAYVYCGNRQSFDVLLRMAAWAKFRTDRLSEEQMQRSLDLEFGGMNEVLASLYAFTGDPKHLTLARRFDHKAVSDPLARGEDNLRGLHANTQIPKIVGSAREYEVTSDTRCRDIATFFWRQIANDRSFAIGGTSNYEHWRTEPGVLSSELSVESAETCCTYNMLKLTKHLFTWSPQADYADYYERAMLNHILASQCPETGMTMYYVGMKPGHFKVYHTPEDAFWCCTGTGMENHAKYGEAIYFHREDVLWVNLFVPSRLDWREQHTCITQTTDFPNGETTTITVSTSTPVALELRLRVPYWAVEGVTVTVNGEPQHVDTAPSSYVAIRRVWRDGDCVQMHLPMRLHIHRAPDDASTAAVMFGPMVLAGVLGTEQLTRDMRYLGDQRGQHQAPSIPVPALVVNGTPIERCIERKAGSLEFRTRGVGRPSDVTLVPFHMLHEDRYAVYWTLVDEKEWERRERERITAEATASAHRADVAQRTLDRIAFSDTESEAGHNLDAEASESGTYAGRGWRHAEGGGWFSFQLACIPNEPVSLLCSYWGSDSGRNFHVMVDGESVAFVALTGKHRDRFYDEEYPVPEALTRGKQVITVTCKAHAGNVAGGVFGCASMLAGKGKK